MDSVTPQTTKSTKIAQHMLLAGAISSGIAYADFVGINISSDYLSANQTSPGYNNTLLGIDDDTGQNRSYQPPLLLVLEHPITLLPNFRYQGYSLDSSDSKQLTSNLTSNGQSFTMGNRLPSSYDLSQDDIVLYYQLMSNWIDLDMGIDLKRFDGEVEYSGSDNPVRLDETIPLLHFSARLELPYNGFYLGADFNNMSLSDSTVEDSTIKLGYQSGNGLGFEGGLKSFSLELDSNDNIASDLEYDGIFLNGYFKF
ncbi:MAG: TIGR04219 family outer membrane beta-barrel protein [Gammaproteobacteria bacterium]|nr:TIGR04219 family outer membrane beta-barrel protein [Gammaproteobacteria bacterium]